MEEEIKIDDKIEKLLIKQANLMFKESSNHSKSGRSIVLNSKDPHRYIKPNDTIARIRWSVDIEKVSEFRGENLKMNGSREK